MQLQQYVHASHAHALPAILGEHAATHPVGVVARQGHQQGHQAENRVEREDALPTQGQRVDALSAAVELNAKGDSEQGRIHIDAVIESGQLLRRPTPARPTPGQQRWRWRWRWPMQWQWRWGRHQGRRASIVLRVRHERVGQNFHNFTLWQQRVGCSFSLSLLSFSFSFLLRVAFIAWLTEEAIPNQVLTYQLHQ